MSGIFINYRRSPDRDWFAMALRDRLAEYVGMDHVFLDERSIDLGDDYRAELNQGLAESDVVIAIIHPEWTAQLRPEGVDWVREELELALRLRKRIIPLLLDGVDPSNAAALPPSVHDIAYRQGYKVNLDSWRRDIMGLIQELGFVLTLWSPDEPESVAPIPHRRWPSYVVAGLTLGALCVPALVLPDNAVAREAAVYLSVWILALLLAPMIGLAMTFLAKKPINFSEHNVHDMSLTSYYLRVAIPGGLFIVLFSVSSILGSPVDPRVIPFLIFIAGVSTLYLAVIIRSRYKDERQREEDWPRGMRDPVRAVQVRQELARLDRQVNLPASVRPTLETCQRADWHLRHLRSAADAARQDGKRGRWRWLTDDHRLVLGCYALWAAGGVGLMIAAALPTLAVTPPLVTAAYTSAVAVVTAEFGYRRQRWQREELAREVDGQLGRIERRLATLRGRRG